MDLRLIGTSWCAPCKALKQLLDSNKIPYKYLDGDTAEGLAEAKAAGARSFPILFIDGIVYIGDHAVKAVKEIQQEASPN